MGQNIFQADAPSAMIQAVGKVVHEFLKPEDAYDLYQTLKQEQHAVDAKLGRETKWKTQLLSGF
jgi:hypothetical protein